MRILINGVYRGGNCPVFYQQVKALGHEVKVVDVTYFKQYSDFSDLINKDDIILPRYNIIDYLCFKFFQRFKYKCLLFTITPKLKKIITSFNPDIIVNHKTSLRANMMNNTGFRRVVNFVYGSEIKGQNLNSKLLVEAIEYAEKTITTTPAARETIVAKYPHFKKDVEVRAANFNTTSNLKVVEDAYNKSKLRESMGFVATDFVIFDNRTLRDEKLSKEVVSAMIEVARKENHIKFILMKGFSGKAECVADAKQRVSEAKLEEHFMFIDVANQQEYYQLILASDAVTSFLPFDQFGEVILHAMFFKKYLILTRLDQYYKALKNNAVYVEGFDVKSIETALLKSHAQQQEIDLEANKQYFIKEFDTQKGLDLLEQTLEEVVNKGL